MEHTKDELEVIEKYQNAIDYDVAEFVKGVMDGNDKLNYVTVAFLSDKASADIERLTGKKVKGSRVVLDINGIKHIENRHGAEDQSDASMKDIDDISRMGYVIMNYDDISYEGETSKGYLDENGNPSPKIVMSKKIDGTYYVVEAVNSSKKKRNYVVTAYLSKNKEQ